MIRAVAVAVALAACNGHDAPAPAAPQPPAPTPTPAPVSADAAPAAAPDAAVPADAPAATTKLGKHGEVCSLGAKHLAGEPHAKVVECGPGLQCCYPCGIAGCDSVCHTNAECQADMQRP